jgi:antitoxin (DNA-binding transcriptional repressor) of toxin-antitoxin stability system
MKLPATPPSSVGIREFRSALAEYIDADTPVTVTRHGQAVGLFVPLRQPTPEALQRLIDASTRVQEVMPLSDQEIEDMASDFEALRRAGRPKRGAKALRIGRAVPDRAEPGV